MGSAVLARHRAQAAADLAVLAAAARVPAGPHVACAAAQSITAAMRTTLRTCDLSELDVIVTVTAGTGLRIGPQAQATARAGPIRPD